MIAHRQRGKLLAPKRPIAVGGSQRASRQRSGRDAIELYHQRWFAANKPMTHTLGRQIFSPLAHFKFSSIYCLVGSTTRTLAANPERVRAAPSCRLGLIKYINLPALLAPASSWTYVWRSEFQFWIATQRIWQIWRP